MDTQGTLLTYTDWIRDKWTVLLTDHPTALHLNLGPNAGGRFGTVGEIIRHIFGAEARYVDRIRNREARDVASVPTGSVEALFALAVQARAELRQLLDEGSEEELRASRIFPIGDFEFEGPASAIVMHTLVHEIRHWAQLGTVLRTHGIQPGLQDFIVSPVHGGEFRRRAP